MNNCTMPHFEQELKTPGSNLRVVLILAVAVLVFAIVWGVSR